MIIAHLRFPTHGIHLVQHDDDRRVTLFKYDGEVCDFEVLEDLDEIADWILAPLPLLKYQVILS